MTQDQAPYKTKTTPKVDVLEEHLDIYTLHQAKKLNELGRIAEGLEHAVIEIVFNKGKPVHQNIKIGGRFYPTQEAEDAARKRLE